MPAHHKYFFPKILHAMIIYVLMNACNCIASEEIKINHKVLEEVIVTAQKREKRLQNTPIAISTLSDSQLEIYDIRGLAQLSEGIVPSLRVEPNGITPSTLIIAIRGNSLTDIGQVTRDGSVAIYLDGIYIGRGQGLATEHADLKRIEILRGPQGTLFGRNATGGAINLVSQQPTGEFGVRQSFTAGRFDDFRSATHINLPTVAGVDAKIDFLHSSRDGWVDNTAFGEADYNLHDSTSGRLSLSSKINDEFSLGYAYDQSRLEAGQLYFQLYQDNIGAIGVEPGRQNQTRFSITPNNPTVTKQKSHTLTALWQPFDQLTIKSLTAYRDMEEDTNNNFAGALYANGLMILENTEHDQLSQEFQIIGSNDQIEWVAGFYHYKEKASQVRNNFYTLDIFGCLTGTPGTPITPTTTFPQCTGPGIPGFPIVVNSESTSRAAYGHLIWTPPVLNDRMNITFGMRYTEDKKSGDRFETTLQTFAFKSQHADPALTIDYSWSDNLSTYIKWSTAYRVGGVNLRSTSFREFNNEEVEAFELGFKSEFWERRVRLNAAVFNTDYDDMQLDFANPDNIAINETINAANGVKVDGAEVDVTMLLSGLQLGVHYTYLDSHMPLQPNPLAGGALEQFVVPQAPEHAGAFTADYTFAPNSLGTVVAHLNMTSTSRYAYFPGGLERQDAYTLWNARLSLSDIKLGNSEGLLKVSAWVKNLTDEEYVIFGFPIGQPTIAIAQAFGTPRTFGIDLSYQL